MKPSVDVSLWMRTTAILARRPSETLGATALSEGAGRVATVVVREEPLPEEVESVRFWSEDRQPVLASQVTIEDISQIISVSLDLKLRESGDAIVKMGRIRGGRLRGG